METPPERDLRELVEAVAPRLFAVVRHDEDGDITITAWGLTHEDGRTDLTSTDGSARMSLGSPERALQLATAGAANTATTRLVWLNGAATGA